MHLPLTVQAALWGLLGGSALILGAAIAYLVTLPPRLVAGVMAAGAGVLISTIAFELVEEAYRQGGLDATATGFLAGAAVYTAANVVISRRGARHRKRSGSNPAQSQSGSEAAGVAIAVGALLDGIPESVVIGASLLEGGAVSFVTVIAVFLSNVPEGLSSAAGMRRAGRSATYVFAVWGGIALASAVAAFLGAFALAGADADVLAATNAVAAGAILAMLADTMIPEAFEATHEYAGMITAGGFLAAFALSKLAG